MYETKRGVDPESIGTRCPLVSGCSRVDGHAAGQVTNNSSKTEAGMMGIKGTEIGFSSEQTVNLGVLEQRKRLCIQLAVGPSVLEERVPPAKQELGRDQLEPGRKGRCCWTE